MRARTTLPLALTLLFGAMILTPAPAVSAEPIKLTYANFPPAPTFPCVQMERWAKEVEKRTGGKVKVQTFPGGTLLPAKNIFDGVISGMADIGNFAMSYQPGRFPVSEVVDLPLGFTSAKVASLTLYDLIEKYKPKEFAQVKVLTLFTCPPTNFMTKAPVRSLADLKGMELRVAGTNAEVVKRLGGIAGFIDAEHALDLGYARKLGLATEDLLISQPDTGEQALEIAEMLVRSGALDVLVVDSVAALVPKAEIEGEMGDSHMGLQARLMSQALRKLTATISKSQTAVIFINQIRMKIGVMFGNPETTTGGNALKFYASVRMDIRRISQIKKDDESIGSRTRVKVVKNKLAPPFREAEFDILYGEGISREGDLLDVGTELEMVEKSGAWYSLDGERIGQGRENARAFLKEHGEIATDLRKKILAHYGIGEAARAAQEGAK